MNDFSLQPHYRVWFYQTNQFISAAKQNELDAELKPFIAEWATHGTQLQAGYEWVNPFLLAIGVDEQAVSPSGCSIDSCVRFLQELGKKHQIDFFVRLKSIVYINNEWKQLEFSEVTESIPNGIKLVDITVFRWKDFLEKGIVAPEKSGLASLFC